MAGAVFSPENGDGNALDVRGIGGVEKLQDQCGGNTLGMRGNTQGKSLFVPIWPSCSFVLQSLPLPLSLNDQIVLLHYCAPSLLVG
ncbi:hypothetical protein [Entomobacter blattae]|uniref:Uncharacterized protein n=1 Tax=Entomobacter blattae TaxID=2762277 RepID=A0A7H1NR88_9PROT|nr:hypothetical protein [Entomobacter blattae]QNT78298.1 hypothetical protein JGUZn3_10700 [Entomobacter blattae]